MQLTDRGPGQRVGDVWNAKPADAREGGRYWRSRLAPPLHVREHLLTCQEHALQADVVDPVPALLGGVDGTADFDDLDVVVATRGEGR